MLSRLPAVAGTFYPSDPSELRRAVDGYLVAGQARTAIGVVAPHAGYVYSGPTAGIVFASVEVPEVVIVMGPNHTGYGPPLSIHPGGTWKTPAGEIRVDEALSAKLRTLDPELVADTLAHEEEHSIEVEVPFLLRRNPRTTLVAIVIGTQDLPVLERLGAAIARFVRENAPGALVVASSDMNHYENDATTRSKDRKAVEKLVKMDERGLDEVCRRDRISMCGRAPAVAMLVAAKALGAKHAELADYRTSADAGGDRARCVGYAGVLVTA